MNRFFYFCIVLSAIWLFASACQTDEASSKARQTEKLVEKDGRNTEFYANELEVEDISTGQSPKRIVAFGHTYDLLQDSLAFQMFCDSIAAQKPDLVFALGDVVCHNQLGEWEKVKSMFGSLACPVYFVPGNHDINYYKKREQGDYSLRDEAENRFVNQVGYRYKLLQDEAANYVLLNLNDTLERTRDFLRFADSQIEKEKVTLVFGHQNIWDPVVSSTYEVKRTWSAKSWITEEILEDIAFGDYFFSGDYRLNFRMDTLDLLGKEVHNVFTGNRAKGDPFYITRIDIDEAGVTIYPIPVPLQELEGW